MGCYKPLHFLHDSHRFEIMENTWLVSWIRSKTKYWIYIWTEFRTMLYEWKTCTCSQINVIYFNGMRINLGIKFWITFVPYQCIGDISDIQNYYPSLITIIVIILLYVMLIDLNYAYNYELDMILSANYMIICVFPICICSQ